ncbi:AAA family ATPase [Actinoplanes solisilvae]|uniref:AAA family ATPase n=1 Tax=Actinoplanes solisilvae TaxID=2486853 RepID=UPI000FDBBEBA|nr:LuxR family transcriptional regulator [Actinoplanes solisilvae]
MAINSRSRTLEFDPVGTSPLRGRDAEIALADRLLSSARAGEGGVLIVDGPAGIGKSRLSHEVVHRAERSGMRVLRAEAARGGAAPFTPLLTAVLGARPPIADPQSFLEGIGASFWIVQRLHSALTTAAEAGPLMIVIDNLQWADTETATAIRTLAADLRQAGVVWVLAVRRGQAGPVISDLLAGLESAGAETLRLGGLSAPAAAAVVEDFVGVEVEPSLLAMTERVDGQPYPYWIIELLRGLHEEDRLRTSEGRAGAEGSQLPRRLTTAVDERLLELPAAGRRVIRMAALLPPSFTAAQLAGLARCPASDLIEPLEDAVRADLLTVGGERIRFVQDVVREAARESLPSSLRSLLERESIDVLLRTGTDTVEVAQILARTAEPGDPEAIATLRTAAHAIAAADPGTAADLFRRTWELCPPDAADRGTLVVSALTHLHRVMRTEEAAELAHRALAGVLSAEDEAAVRLIESTVAVRAACERVEDNRQALALSGLTTRDRGEHSAWLAYNLLESGDATGAEHHARQVLAHTADESTAPARLALAAVHAGRFDGTAASAELDLMPRRRGTMLDLHTGNLLHCLGRTGAGKATLSDGARHARRDHDAPLGSLGTQLSALTNMMTGQLVAARADLETPGAGEGDDAPVTVVTVLRMATAAALAQHLGDAKLGRAATSIARRLRVGDSVVGRRWAHRVLATAAAARGDVLYAARLLADDPLEACGMALPADMGAVVLATWIGAAAGDGSLIERAAAAAGRMRAGGAGAPAFAAGAAYVDGLLDDSPDQLVSASRALLAADRPLLAALALEDAGQRLIREGHQDVAVVHLTTAGEIFGGAGSVVDVRRVSRSLRGHATSSRLVGERSADGWASLTDAELKVVRLVAAGATNRGAAQQLFLSPHTVSSHVRHAFAKLGIRSRVQLANLLRDNDG